MSFEQSCKPLENVNIKVTIYSKHLLKEIRMSCNRGDIWPVTREKSGQNYYVIIS